MTINKLSNSRQSISSQSDSLKKISKEIQPNPAAASSEAKTIQAVKLTKDSFVSQTASKGSLNFERVVQHVTRESYLQGTEDLKSYADKVKYYNQMKKEIRDDLKGVRGHTQEFKEDLIKKFDALRPGQTSGNVMETLILVFRDSIKDMNEDKKYYLGKLQKFNSLSGSLGDYMQKISEASGRVSKKDDDDD